MSLLAVFKLLAFQANNFFSFGYRVIIQKKNNSEQKKKINLQALFCK
tara:strand:+ start:1949 stop:2089 length:141 start_codon:yes stop_codon:yes gene_type:complete